MRWIAAWVLFRLGQLAGLLRLFAPYQWLMLKSCEAQGDGPGPWLDVDDDFQFAVNVDTD